MNWPLLSLYRTLDLVFKGHSFHVHISSACVMFYSHISLIFSYLLYMERQKET